MKTSIAFILGIALSLGSLSAQECPASKAKACDAQAATCQATAQCTDEATNEVAVAFNKLTAEQKKAVSEAFVSLAQTCPVGSKVPGTVMALDRLYTEALTSLAKIAKQDQLPEQLRADAKKHAATIAKLAASNKMNIETMKLVGSAAGCCDSAKKADCGTDCCAEAKGGAISSAGEFTKKWATAMADYEKITQCEKTMADMKAKFAVLKQYGVDVPGMVTASLREQLATLETCGAAIACPKGGLMAKNKELCSQCSWTNENLTKTAGSVVAAHKLLKAVPYLAKKDDAKGAANGECSESKGECSASKECTKVKQ